MTPVRLKLVRGGKDFFALFEAMDAKVDEGARELPALLKNLDRVEERVQRVLDIEHEGDEITHEIVRGDRHHLLGAAGSRGHPRPYRA
ncbi:MAG: DUF47 family protein [Actinomycetota bacterium]